MSQSFVNHYQLEKGGRSPLVVSLPGSRTHQGCRPRRAGRRAPIGSKRGRRPRRFRIQPEPARCLHLSCVRLCTWCLRARWMDSVILTQDGVGLRSQASTIAISSALRALRLVPARLRSWLQVSVSRSAARSASGCTWGCSFAASLMGAGLTVIEAAAGSVSGTHKRRHIVAS